MSLSRAQIDAVNDLPREEVDVPEWGGSVFVHTLTAGEVLGLYRAGDENADGKFAVRMLAMALRDGDGAAIFDAESLEKRNPGVVLRLIKAAERLNNLGAAADEAIAKN